LRRACREAQLQPQGEFTRRLTCSEFPVVLHGCRCLQNSGNASSPHEPRRAAETEFADIGFPKIHPTHTATARRQRIEPLFSLINKKETISNLVRKMIKASHQTVVSWTTSPITRRHNDEIPIQS
jgi:hypothetical protein